MRKAGKGVIMPSTIRYGENLDPKDQTNQITARKDKPLDPRFKKQLRVLFTDVCKTGYKYKTLKIAGNNSHTYLHDDGIATDIAFYSNKKKRFLNGGDDKELTEINRRLVYMAAKKNYSILINNKYHNGAVGHFEFTFLPSIPKNKNNNVLTSIQNFFINIFPHIKTGRR